MMRKLTVGAVLVLAMNANVLATGPYVGAKAAWLSPDDSLGVSFDTAINAGLVLGYVFQDTYGLAVEAEFNKSISDGEWSYLGSKGDYDIDTNALYLVSRLGQEAYFKIKAGYLDGSGSVNIPGFGTIKGDDQGFSWGLGAGYHFTSNIAAEVEWTQIETDVNAWSLGVNYGFN